MGCDERFIKAFTIHTVTCGVVQRRSDEVLQKLKSFFYKIMLLGWTHVKDLKHLRFTL